LAAHQGVKARQIIGIAVSLRIDRRVDGNRLCRKCASASISLFGRKEISVEPHEGDREAQADRQQSYSFSEPRRHWSLRGRTIKKRNKHHKRNHDSGSDEEHKAKPCAPLDQIDGPAAPDQPKRMDNECELYETETDAQAVG
jgi:hypothetical protein